MLHDVNLLPKTERANKSVKIVLVSIGLTWFVISGLLVFNYFNDKSVSQQLTNQQQNLQNELSLVGSTENEETNEGPTYKTAVDYASSISLETSLLLSELIDLQPEFASLTGYTLTTENLEINYQFETMNDVSLFIERLESTDMFVDVKVKEIETYIPGEEEDVDGELVVIPRYVTSLILDINEGAISSGGDSNE